MKYFWVFILFLPIQLVAQVDKLPPETPSDFQQLIEDFLAESDQEEFDFNTVLESLEFYLDSPMDLNNTDEPTLREFVLLNSRQIDELIRYRTQIGPLLSLYELQAIPGFDLPSIRRILPFVTVDGDTYDYNLSLKQMITTGQNELYLRWGRILETQKGYRPLEAGETASRYAGDPNQLYTRFKHSYGNRLSYGFTAEKDRGESFFSGNNKKGFDFYTAHFYLRNYNQKVKALALGDYSISLGQGLVLYSGFAYRKSTQVTNIRRGGRVVRPYTSVNEAFYMRGAAATLGISKDIDVTVFGSIRNRDANFIDPVDTFAIDPDLSVIASLGTTGLHRTPSEIENKNVSRQFSSGGSIKFQRGNRHIALNAVYNRFGNEVDRDYQPYNQFDFRGQQLFNASLDYGIMLRNISFFGETAMSDNGAIASLNGILIGLTPKVDFALLHRYYPRNYQVLEANPFGETRGGRNEQGLYMAMEIRPHKNWKITGYFDRWHHPWLRFLANAPSRGHEYRARITWWAKRKFEFYLELREETKEKNFASNESKTRLLLDHRTFQTRFNFGYNLSKSLTIRSRLDFGFHDNGQEPRSTGVVIYQDVIYKSLEFPLSFSTRFVLMDTDGFDARYYSYENNLLYTFSIPPYYNKGSRFYLNLRYRGIRNLTIEARIERTLWTNQTSIGGGLEEIEGNTRTGVSAQIKYKF